MEREVREVLEAAFAQMHGLTMAAEDWDALGWIKADRFRRFLDAEAYTDAALMLVPDGWRISNLSQHDHPLLRERGEWLCTLFPDGALGTLHAGTLRTRCDHALHPALAIAQASLKTKDADHAPE